MAEEGSASRDALPDEHQSSAESEPEISGTLFLTTLLLVMIFGFWVLMYWTLLHR